MLLLQGCNRKYCHNLLALNLYKRYFPGFIISSHWPTRFRHWVIIIFTHGLRSSVRLSRKKPRQNIYAINDPLGQTHSPASSNHYSHLQVALFWKMRTKGRTDTTWEKMINTGRDCGSASWIKKLNMEPGRSLNSPDLYDCCSSHSLIDPLQVIASILNDIPSIPKYLWGWSGKV